MPGVPFTARSTKVQVLAAVALVLFSLVFLRFVTLTFADEAPRPTTYDITVDVEVLSDLEIREAQQVMEHARRHLEEIERQIAARKVSTSPRWIRPSSTRRPLRGPM